MSDAPRAAPRRAAPRRQMASFSPTPTTHCSRAIVVHAAAAGADAIEDYCSAEHIKLNVIVNDEYWLDVATSLSAVAIELLEIILTCSRGLMKYFGNLYSPSNKMVAE